MNITAHMRRAHGTNAYTRVNSIKALIYDAKWIRRIDPFSLHDKIQAA